jgi:hypothetical protein
MDDKAEKLKALIKGKVKDRPTFGTDPNDPWSVKSNVNEDETISEDELLNRYMKTRGLNPKTASKISKISASKTGDFDKWKRQHVSGGRLPVFKVEQVTQNASPTLKRQRVLDRAFKKSKPIRISGPDLHRNIHHGTTTEEVDRKDTITMDIPLLIRVLELAREDLKTDMDLHRVVEKLIDIRNNGTLTMDDYDFVAKLKESLQLEDTFQDTYAATQSVSPETYNQSTDDTENSVTKKAKLIKKIHKESRVFNEDLYDHEKEDKSVETPGKKASQPKVGKLPDATAVLTGGTTETGKARDDIELDPVMKNRPGNTSFKDQTQKKNINK